MAYDVAAANSEAYLCDILQSSEKQRWKEEHSAEEIYDPLAIHSTVLMTVHENQRAASSFPLSLMAPKFSASALTQQDVCGPWSLPNGRPSTKDDVHLPLAAASGASSTRPNMQRGWFWLTEWVVDKTDPNTDNEGWQYGKSLTDVNQQWSAMPPTSGSSWVRRRKWIRVMKKRMDLVTTAGGIPEEVKAEQSHWAQEMAGNYSKRAKLALRLDDGFKDKEQELARYRQAIQILLNGIKFDKDSVSKQTASDIVKEYLQHAEELADSINQRKAALGDFRQLDTPRPQIASRSSEGSSGSGSELRRLTLQKSRPSDVATLEELVHHHPNGDSDADAHSEGTSNGSFASTTNIVNAYTDIPDGMAADPQRQSSLEGEEALEQHPGNDHETEFSTITLSSVAMGDDQDLAVTFDATTLDTPNHDDILQSEVTSNHSESSSIPIPAPSHPVPEVAITNASPATVQAEPFPITRLTRISRPATPSSSSTSIVAMSSQNNTRAESEPGSEPSQAQGSSRDGRTGAMQYLRQPLTSFPTPNAFPSQDRASSSRIQSMQTPQPSPRQQPRQVQPPVVEAKWESDHKAIECRECHRKFSLWLRRHHCRRCGHVVCDRCSSHRAMLHPSMVVFDPTSSEAYLNHQMLVRRGTVQSYRVCDSCYTALGPGRSLSLGAASGFGSESGSGLGSGSPSGMVQHNTGPQQAHRRMLHGDAPSHPTGYASSAPAHNDGSLGVYMSGSAYAPDRSHSSSRSSSSSSLHPVPMVRNASSSSLMSECPVCGAILAGLEGGKPAQEAHVQDCLEGKSGQGSGPVRYVVYKLPADSPLIDQECAICFEEFVAGRTVARLNCLCTYHRHCIHSWLQHGNSCPVHYR
ncbi:hypothetical protein BC939DRAFT_335343 [Gamsiella multidivaricata]|uniref:uncharacterized protein n=1 Tax=Gamsiella multidivaricata TaxID=101098 RepID=UPI00221EE1BB|nr:uncharacterized protein BC939DRAFT_335343 [Gamsiella multidivaricata]KAI7817234.1 hypothetical protein BC939DRAFT_335343 [Gamsiella multidivaricata]